MKLHILINIIGPTISVQSIFRSVGQKVSFLGGPVGDFEACDDDHMLLMVDLKCQ